MRHPTEALLLSLLALLGIPSPADACSCLPPSPVPYALEDATTVFLGEVLSRKTVASLDDGVALDARYLLRVSQIWKGPADDTIEVRTASAGTACGAEFEIGEEYLVYAYGSPPTTNSCTRTGRYQGALDGDLLLLGEPEWVNPQVTMSLLDEDLLEAALEGEDKTLRRLLAAGEDPNGRDRTGGMTALIAASSRGRATSARLLIDAGAQVDQVKRGRTALDEAIRRQHLEVVRVLLSAKAEPTPEALASAVATGSVEIVRALIEAGAEVNESRERARPALVLAAFNGHDGVVRLLLDSGAHVNERDPWGKSALDVAAERDHEELVRLLLSRGARPSTDTLREGARSGRSRILELVSSALRALGLSRASPEYSSTPPAPKATTP